MIEMWWQMVEGKQYKCVWWWWRENNRNVVAVVEGKK